MIVVKQRWGVFGSGGSDFENAVLSHPSTVSDVLRPRRPREAADRGGCWRDR